CNLKTNHLAQVDFVVPGFAGAGGPAEVRPMVRGHGPLLRRLVARLACPGWGAVTSFASLSTITRPSVSWERAMPVKATLAKCKPGSWAWPTPTAACRWPDVPTQDHGHDWLLLSQ